MDVEKLTKGLKLLNDVSERQVTQLEMVNEVSAGHEKIGTLLQQLESTNSPETRKKILEEATRLQEEVNKKAGELLTFSKETSKMLGGENTDQKDS